LGLFIDNKNVGIQPVIKDHLVCVVDLLVGDFILKLLKDGEVYSLFGYIWDIFIEE
jgi:hypothetical protein